MEESGRSLLVVTCLLACTSFLLGCGEDNPGDDEKTWEERVEESKKYCIAWVNDVAGYLYDLEFSPDGKYLGVAYGSGIELRNPETLALVRRLEIKSGAYALSFSPDAKMVASAGWGEKENNIEIWSVDEARQVRILRGHEREVYDVDFSPDGKMVASASGDGTCRVWDAQSGDVLAVFHGNGDIIKTVGFSPAGELLAFADFYMKDAYRLYFVDLKALELVKSIDVGRAIGGMDFSPDGRYIVIGGCEIEGEPGEPPASLWTPIDVWRIEDFQLERRWDSECGVVKSLGFSHDGRFISSGHEYGALTQLWEASTGRLILSLSGHRRRVSAVSFHPDGKTFASGGSMGVIALWRVPEELLGKPKEEGGE